MGQMFSGLFGGGAEKSPKPPGDKQGTKKQAELAKQRQGRGLAGMTDLSSMREMIGAYQSGKTTLGAG